MISIFTGKVTDYREHYESHGGRANATLHHKIWLKDESGIEKKFHITKHNVSVRKDHLISVLQYNDSVIGYLNHTSLDSGNFQFRPEGLHWFLLIVLVFLFVNVYVSALNFGSALFPIVVGVVVA